MSHLYRQLKGSSSSLVNWVLTLTPQISAEKVMLVLLSPLSQHSQIMRNQDGGIFIVIKRIPFKMSPFLFWAYFTRLPNEGVWLQYGLSPFLILFNAHHMDLFLSFFLCYLYIYFLLLKKPTTTHTYIICLITDMCDSRSQSPDKSGTS